MDKKTFVIEGGRAWGKSLAAGIWMESQGKTDPAKQKVAGLAPAKQPKVNFSDVLKELLPPQANGKNS